MNRKQRRAAGRHARIEMVDLRKVVMPPSTTIDDCYGLAVYRLGLNLGETGHPFHHLTANGAIVDSDPTLEYCLGRLKEEDSTDLRKRYGNMVSSNAKPTIPVKRDHYGHDPYAKQA